MAAEFLAASGINLYAEMAKIQFDYDIADASAQPTKPQAPPPRYSDVYPSGCLQKIVDVRLLRKPPSTLWDVSIGYGKISAIEPHALGHPDISHLPGVLHASKRLLAPSLCHAHIHLDKCFLLQDLKFGDLEIEEGDFREAMVLTSKAKSRFEESDPPRRGRQLIQESIQHGVMAMRAFVEVDGEVKSSAPNLVQNLNRSFEDKCEIQICAFAQLLLFRAEMVETR